MVNKMLLHPQEIETFYILPTLRRYFAIYMKEQGMKQKDIAQLLGITTASISQYTSEKRAHQIDFDEKTLEEIKKSALKIKDRFSYMKETQTILTLLRNSDVLCKIHKQFSEVPEDCEPKAVGCLVASNCLTGGCIQ